MQRSAKITEQLVNENCFGLSEVVRTAVARRIQNKLIASFADYIEDQRKESQKELEEICASWRDFKSQSAAFRGHSTRMQAIERQGKVVNELTAVQKRVSNSVEVAKMHKINTGNAVWIYTERVRNLKSAEELLLEEETKFRDASEDLERQQCPCAM